MIKPGYTAWSASMQVKVSLQGLCPVKKTLYKGIFKLRQQWAI
jgi:hypothetical protein